MRPAAATVLTCLAAVALAACSGSTAAQTPTTTSDLAVAVELPDDGVLRIGVLLPLTGPGAELGAAMIDAVELAVDEIEAAGGVRVQRIVRDEGADADSASRSLEELLAGDVDAIVGPASSTVAGAIVPATTEAGVLTCSPTASAMSLDDLPDRNLFVRTIPSDSLQATAVATLVEQSGEQRVSILYLDDAFGRPLAEAVRSRLDDETDVVAFIPYTADDVAYADEAARSVTSGARSTVVIGDRTAGPRMVDALFGTAGLEGEVVINDAMRVPATTSIYARLGPNALRRLHGVSPVSVAVAPSFIGAYTNRTGAAPALFAGNAYDCVNLIALAAASSGSTEARMLADEIGDISSVGNRCSTYADCKAELDVSRNIDYEGAGGELEIGTNGDPQRGVFDVFVFDDDGRDLTSNTDPQVVVGR
jgi:branched-chain amino acid transport system substrate-binding protein